MSLETILDEVREKVKFKKEIREKTQENMRKVLSLSKQTIFLIHQKKSYEAKKKLNKAKKILSGLLNISRENPEILYSSLFHEAQQEYSEANIFLTLNKEGRFITPKEINVSSIDYVLGLADVIGEYRRFTLDALREGNLEKSEKGLQIMDEIYIGLMALDEVYMDIHGLRRKCDVARKIIEITRGDVTQEVRRTALKKYLESFENSQKKRE
jgi:translin